MNLFVLLAAVCARSGKVLKVAFWLIVANIILFFVLWMASVIFIFTISQFGWFIP